MTLSNNVRSQDENPALSKAYTLGFLLFAFDPTGGHLSMVPSYCFELAYDHHPFVRDRLDDKPGIY